MQEVLSLEVELLLKLGDDEAPKLDEARAVIIHDKRALSSILKLLSNASLPSHLKRLRHVDSCCSEVLLCDEEEISRVTNQAKLETRQVSIPQCAPLTVNQVKLWSQRYWPVCFSSKQAAPPTLAAEFPQQELAKLEQWITQSNKFAVQIIDPRTNMCLANAIAIHETPQGIAHPIMLALDAAAKVVQQSTCADDYLCTGMDVFLLHEPCVMCAMALLHSRVGRVFFRFANEESGALRSKCRLHTLPSINHRYRVFQYSAAAAAGEDKLLQGKCF